MIIGTTIFRMGGEPAYSPEFPRGGPAALFSIEVLAVSDSPTLVATIQTKNHEDGTWTDLAAFSGMSTVGLYTKDATGLKQLVRLKYTFTTTDAADAVRFFVPEPSWRPLE
ncbi:MAG: hypothetical protein HC813_00260 [Planctomycetes bacterium]|nr:hypothetical protein [Planctomycetota bacterium]